MKRLWWIWIGLFFLGFALGAWIGTQGKEEHADAPVFTFTVPPSTDTFPAEPPGDILSTPSSSDSQILPCSLQYTSLVAWSLAAYDGPCLEDGTGDELIGVTALILENTGTIGIHYAQIVIMQEGTELRFDATYIPPRSTVLIIESSRAPYSSAEPESCRCVTVIPENFGRSEDQISVSPSGICSMEVTNLTGQDLSCVRIYYKQLVADGDLYVGGITYSAIVTDLAAGETRVITPYRYACGYADVVAVEVDPV